MTNGSNNLLDQKFTRLNTIIGWGIFLSVDRLFLHLGTYCQFLGLQRKPFYLL